MLTWGYAKHPRNKFRIHNVLQSVLYKPTLLNTRLYNATLDFRSCSISSPEWFVIANFIL